MLLCFGGHTFTVFWVVFPGMATRFFAGRRRDVAQDLLLKPLMVTVILTTMSSLLLCCRPSLKRPGGWWFHDGKRRRVDPLRNFFFDPSCCLCFITCGIVVGTKNGLMKQVGMYEDYDYIFDHFDQRSLFGKDCYS